MPESTQSGQQPKAKRRPSPPTLSLFDVPARADSPPQVEAARKFGRQARGQALRILRTLQAGGRMTREEICDATGIPIASACSALYMLEWPGRKRPALLAGPPLVRKAGRRRARSGVRVWLYAVSEAGRRL